MISHHVPPLEPMLRGESSDNSDDAAADCCDIDCGPPPNPTLPPPDAPLYLSVKTGNAAVVLRDVAVDSDARDELETSDNVGEGGPPVTDEPMEEPTRA